MKQPGKADSNCLGNVDHRCGIHRYFIADCHFPAVIKGEHLRKNQVVCGLPHCGIKSGNIIAASHQDIGPPADPLFLLLRCLGKKAVISHCLFSHKLTGKPVSADKMSGFIGGGKGG